MKGLLCADCVDFRALPPTGSVSCRCGNVEAWWVDSVRGIAEYRAFNRLTAFGIGVHNGYLQGAVDLQGMSGGADRDHEWRKLHDEATNAPGYLFDSSRRNCWALIFKPGVTYDTSWVDSP